MGAKKSGMMVHLMKATSLMEENVVLGHSNLLMGQFSKVNSKIIRLMDKEYINGVMERFIKEVGIKIKCTVKEF